MSVRSLLPAPDPVAAAHGARVAAAIRAAIDAAGGSIGFDEFMRLALYAPGLGYYQAGAARFGTGGDFTTAPELSPVFARCLARQIREWLDAIGPGARILEFGAGSGRLAQDLLDELARSGGTAPGYDILEVSADLRARQRERLAAGHAGVAWLDRLPAAPWDGVVIANEVLDAMPVVRLRRQGEAVEELRVGTDGAGFAWRTAPASAADRAGLEAIEVALGTPVAQGQVVELCPMFGPWLAALAAVVRRGAVLLVDYGGSRAESHHPGHRDGNLVCHYRHRMHADPLVLAGLQDLSCAVDFSAVADAACAAGFDLAGYATQAHFLIGCGLDEVLGSLQELPHGQALRLASQARTLVLPGEMGERFKALVLTRGLPDRPWRGFSFADHRARL
ncbi:MAG: class I SAM-dependent methyltransferase [Gammaproteobacteria bacterium]